jgi:hypothetical protein
MGLIQEVEQARYLPQAMEYWEKKYKNWKNKNVEDINVKN